MKKFFSLIAVTVVMVAASSVFTSCSKDGSGSSYSPEFKNSTFMQNAVTPEQSAQKVDSIMQQWAQHLNHSME